jgi:cell division protease FtsH
VGWALPCADPIHKVTIIPRGQALGYTQEFMTEDRRLMHRGELWNQMARRAGGRAAEELIFADPTTGPANDVEKATEFAQQTVTRFGTKDPLGFIMLSRQDEGFSASRLGDPRHTLTAPQPRSTPRFVVCWTMRSRRPKPS